MRVSIIIPFWPIAPEKDLLLDKCVRSLPRYDELIVVVNEGIGFAAAVNRGLRIARGDFLCVVNDDIEWIRGTFEELCDASAVTCPIMNRGARNFLGAFFCIPRWVYEKIGGLDERFKVGYFEDDDYIMRLTETGIPMQCKEACEIRTKGGETMSHIPNKDQISYDNYTRFYEKWGRTPISQRLKIFHPDGSIEWKDL